MLNFRESIVLNLMGRSSPNKATNDKILRNMVSQFIKQGKKKYI